VFTESLSSNGLLTKNLYSRERVYRAVAYQCVRIPNSAIGHDSESQFHSLLVGLKGSTSVMPNSATEHDAESQLRPLVLQYKSHVAKTKLLQRTRSWVPILSNYHLFAFFHILYLLISHNCLPSHLLCSITSAVETESFYIPRSITIVCWDTDITEFAWEYAGNCIDILFLLHSQSSRWHLAHLFASLARPRGNPVAVKLQLPSFLSLFAS
jgi:hypothetical protein